MKNKFTISDRVELSNEYKNGNNGQRNQDRKGTVVSVSDESVKVKWDTAEKPVSVHCSYLKKVK